MLPTMALSPQLIGRTVTPFLKDHIPGIYAPLVRRRADGDDDDYDDGDGGDDAAEPRRRDANTKYCYRHRPDSKCRRAADEDKMALIQSELDQLTPADQQAITHVWSLFSAAPAKHRDLMLQGIMTQCCFPQLSRVAREVQEQLKIDFLTALPAELTFKVLCYLDAVSLCRASQVSKTWRELADDENVWHRICEQHIDRKCTKCGFGLPLLERNRLRQWTKQQQLAKSRLEEPQRPRIPAKRPSLPAPNTPRSLSPSPSSKRDASELEEIVAGKRRCLSKSGSDDSTPTVSSMRREQERRFRGWKSVYKERYVAFPPFSPLAPRPLALAPSPPPVDPAADRARFRVGSNWKYGRCSVKVFRGHTNGVTCLQIDDNIMATGSYDTTIRIWDVTTGQEIRQLRAHTRGIRALQFDERILVSGSLDGTIKIWNYHTGELLNTLACHTDGVISVNLSGEILASGSIDKTVKVINLKTKESFTLKGHTDWVNQVRIDTESRTLFSASDDCKIKMWDLDSRQCIRTFEGHVGHVQQVLPLPPDFEVDDAPGISVDNADTASAASGRGGTPFAGAPHPQEGGTAGPSQQSGPDPRAAYGARFLEHPSTPLPARYILSGALDSTIRWYVPRGRHRPSRPPD